MFQTHEKDRQVPAQGENSELHLLQGSAEAGCTLYKNK